MLNIKLPKTRYKLAAGVAPNYPNLEERADGAPIPIAYGDLHGVIPICIDKTTFKYKLAGHAIHAIDAVMTEEATLTLTADYTVDLALAEFTLCSTPYLAANTLYYFYIEASYVISGTNYISFKKCAAPGYAGGQAFQIDGAGVWTAVPGSDLLFRVQGSTTLSGRTIHQVETGCARGAGFALRDHADRTRIGQSFLTGATPFYAKLLQFWTTKKGAPPASTVRCTILSAYTPAEVRIGAQSIVQDIDVDPTWWSFKSYFPLQSDETSFLCNIEGAEKTIGVAPPAVGATIIDGANFLEDLVVTRLGKTTAGLLDATALANFKAKRTQAIAAYVDRDTTFGEIVGKLESSLLFKLIPLHDGTYAPTVYEADTVEVRPHFFDEHFLSFSMRHDFSAVKTIVKIKYDENPGNNEFKVTEADSDVARFVYGVEDTLEVETYLKTEANAATLAADYLGMYETPPLEITFEIRGYGLNLIPGRDKVKITRTRAAYAGGALSGVLFRITKITKKPGTASTEIVAVQDDQTY